MSALSSCLMLAMLMIGSQATEVTPVQKVLQMMDEIKAKAIKEKQDEEVTFTKFSVWCTNTDKHKEEAIARGAAEIERLSSLIEKLDNDARVLGEEIQKLDETNQADSNEKSAATAIREGEQKDYNTLHEEHVQSIDEIGRGTEKLKQMMSSGPGAAAAASFVQKFARTATLVPKSRQVLMAFLATSSSIAEVDADALDLQAPEAATFESQSGGIVDMMVELHDKMKDEDIKLTSEEMDSKHAYQMLAQTLTDKIEKQTASRNRKASTKKEKERDSAEAKGDLSETKAAKDADEKYLADLRATCEQKHTDFEARQKLRAEELEALDKAIEIIAGGAVSGAADKHLPSLVQTSTQRTILAQLRASTTLEEVQSAAATYLEMQGKRIHSPVLLALSSRVSTGAFKKIMKMIKDMIMKLTEEATDEAEHKGFCDTELGTNKITRDSKSAEVGELTATIEGLNAKSAKLANQISQLAEDIAQSDAAVAKATANRNEEKAKNTATIADAKGAISAVSQAKKVLEDFYAKAAGATAFVQGVDDDMPETFDKPFTGTGGEGGIVGMLEVILSDFQRLEAETTENEVANSAEFESFMNDSQMDKAVKGQEVKNKEGMKQKTASATQDATTDLQSTQEELDAAMLYFEKLKPSCVDTGISYEDRVARREEEVQSLQEALKILTP